MRLSITILGLACGVAALSACGGSRASVMAKAEADCLASTEKSGAPPGVNAQRLCSCVVTKVSEGKTDEQVRTIFAQKEAPPEAMESIGQCMVQEINSGGK